MKSQAVMLSSDRMPVKMSSGTKKRSRSIRKRLSKRTPMKENGSQNVVRARDAKGRFVKGSQGSESKIIFMPIQQASDGKTAEAFCVKTRIVQRRRLMKYPKTLYLYNSKKILLMSEVNIAGILFVENSKVSEFFLEYANKFCNDLSELKPKVDNSGGGT